MNDRQGHARSHRNTHDPLHSSFALWYALSVDNANVWPDDLRVGERAAEDAHRAFQPITAHSRLAGRPQPELLAAHLSRRGRQRARQDPAAQSSDHSRWQGLLASVADQKIGPSSVFRLRQQELVSFWHQYPVGERNNEIVHRG